MPRSRTAAYTRALDTDGTKVVQVLQEKCGDANFRELDRPANISTMNSGRTVSQVHSQETTKSTSSMGNISRECKKRVAEITPTTRPESVASIVEESRWSFIKWLQGNKQVEAAMVLETDDDVDQ